MPVQDGQDVEIGDYITPVTADYRSKEYMSSRLPIWRLKSSRVLISKDNFKHKLTAHRKAFVILPSDREDATSTDVRCSGKSYLRLT